MPDKRKHAARSNGNGTGHKELEQTEPREAPVSSFTNSGGQHFQIQGISPWAMETLPLELEDEWTQAGRPKPAKPTYKVETAGGGEEVREHDETTVETDDEKAAWAQYLAENTAWEKELRERMLKNILMDGVIVQPIDDKWLARERFMGRRVPDDPLELEYYWKKTQVIRSTDDAQRIMTAVLALTGVSEEAIRVAEASFRDPVEQPDGAKTGGPVD